MANNKSRESGICIVLDDKYRLGSDSNNIILEESYIPKKGPKAGKEVWRSIAFFRTIDEAIVKYFKVRTYNSEANDAAKLITEWNKCLRSLRKIMKEYHNGENE